MISGGGAAAEKSAFFVENASSVADGCLDVGTRELQFSCHPMQPGGLPRPSVSSQLIHRNARNTDLLPACSGWCEGVPRRLDTHEGIDPRRTPLAMEIPPDQAGKASRLFAGQFSQNRSLNQLVVVPEREPG